VRSICVFCGSAAGARAEYGAATAEAGARIAAHGWRLVYGGGRAGLMGVVADAALAVGGTVVGVIPRHLTAWEVEHRGLTELHEVESMHQRKALMAEWSDAFLVLPGGLGTLDEMCEILTWAQLGLHGKPVGLLNVAGYFDALLAFLDHAVVEGFLSARGRARLFVADDVATLLDALAAAPEAPAP
jgi:uncharacterized protein (TIGR00730 family)